jgi:hypothetical protein
VLCLAIGTSSANWPRPTRCRCCSTARLERNIRAHSWQQKGRISGLFADGPGWSRTTARRFEGRRIERFKRKLSATTYIPARDKMQRIAGAGTRKRTRGSRVGSRFDAQVDVTADGRNPSIGPSSPATGHRRDTRLDSSMTLLPTYFQETSQAGANPIWRSESAR